MTRSTILTGFLAATALLAACSGEKRAPDNAAATAANATEAAPAADGGNAASANEGAAVPAADTLSFSRYVGKYPFDKVGPHSWNDDPAVKSAIEAAVSDAGVRKWVLAAEGPSSPIEMIDGKVAAWTCETHNCGPHQWVTLIDPVTGAAQVCYFDEAAAADKTRWFIAGKEESRSGQCPQGERG
ncbi:Inhibitor of vertebrate lysozyme (Ivy) [Sphingobium faniae]|nr:Inhibitor of vertebrate lysozyme (Ivy) [Sphingobium faniae]